MSKKILVSVVIAALLCVSGCGSGYTAGTTNLIDEAGIISCGGDTPEDPQAVKLHGLSERIFAEAWKACGENDNFLMSPLSLIEVLGMVSEGASGQTRQQLEQLFGYSTNALSQYMRYLENNLPSEDDARLEIANSIWIRDTEALEVKEDFLKNVKEYYDAAVFKAAFDDSTVGDINRWCADNTDDMIDEILKQINPAQMMFLINAICFDANWAEPYEKHDVYEHKFYLEDGSTVETSYMCSEEYGYLIDENTTGFIRPYKNGYSFAALLPAEGLTMEEYLEDFNGSKLETLLAEKRDEAVSCILPKFSGETCMNLNNMLKNQGITELFDENSADLTLMAELCGESLYVSEIIQKTFIEVDEQGTRAAAVTLAVTEGRGMGPENMVELNRPFVYAIIDDASGLPIFLGVVMNPTD